MRMCVIMAADISQQAATDEGPRAGYNAHTVRMYALPRWICGFLNRHAIAFLQAYSFRYMRRAF